MKKLLALVLCLCTLMTVFPASFIAFAAEEDEGYTVVMNGEDEEYSETIYDESGLAGNQRSRGKDHRSFTPALHVRLL
jgi:hypothetical protein